MGVCLMERNWTLGDDLLESDNLLDPVTFESLILTVHCNCPVIDKKAVKETMKGIMDERLADMRFLLEKNMDAIIAAALKGRGQCG